jgi:hypothetical protein
MGRGGVEGFFNIQYVIYSGNLLSYIFMKNLPTVVYDIKINIFY